MATFETAELGIRVFQWASNLRRNIRSNAQGYKNALVAGRTPAQVAAVANEDAAEYLKTIGGLDLFISEPEKRTKLLDGLLVFGIAALEAQNELSALRAAAKGQRDANKNNAAQINGMADAILSGLPAYEYPERLP